MNHKKRLFLPLLLALLLVGFAISLAQTGQQSNQKKQTEACCAMDSCCCNGDSCDMQKHDAKKEGEKGCCCCSGDSCDMTAQHDAKNHADKHDCCAAMANNMTAKHDMKKHDQKNHDMKDGCCCCSDSCEMKVKQAGN